MSSSAHCLSSNIFFYENTFEIFNQYRLKTHKQSFHFSSILFSFEIFLKSFNPVFVGNETVPANIVELLFDKTQHIKTPAQGSYKDIDRIEQETVTALKQRGRQFDVVVVAMGCSGRALEKRILKNYSSSVFLFDFGSLLDILCGSNTRAWMDLTKLPENYWQTFLEQI